MNGLLKVTDIDRLSLFYNILDRGSVLSPTEPDTDTLAPDPRTHTVDID